MNKYIIFRTESASAHGWEKRKLAHSQMGTSILAEHFYTDKPIPKTGDRVLEFVKVPGYEDVNFPGTSTHYRYGDWEIVKVEEYTPEIPVSVFDSIVICYCRYSPITPVLEPLPPVQISVDSFGGKEEAYSEYLNS